MNATKPQARPGVMVGVVDVDTGKLSVQSSKCIQESKPSWLGNIRLQKGTVKNELSPSTMLNRLL